MHSPNLSLPPGEMSRQRQRGLGSLRELDSPQAKTEGVF